MSYCTDQLLAINFSGGSTLNGTPGGDRWARVLGGQIGWLSYPLRRVQAGCSETGSTNDLKMQIHGKRGKKIRPVRNTSLNPQQPGDRDHLETARETPRSTREPTLAGFVEIDLVQLSQSVKTTNVTHPQTHTDIQTNTLN